MSDKKASEKAPVAQEKSQKAPEAPVSGGGYVGWGDVGVRPQKGGAANGDKKTLPYLKLEEGKPYRIRLVHKPYRFYSHFDVIRAISPGLDSDVCWQAGNAPRERYVILVLDRNDGNQLKILEAGPAVFNEFKTYFELTGGKDPGDKGGPDWLIQVKIPVKVKDGRQFKDKRMTKYNVMRDEATPFTPEEVQYIKDNWVELSKLKAAASPEMIKAMFEEAKVKSDSDPVPGSSEWWKARREKREAGDSSDDKPIVPPETDSAAKLPEVQKMDASQEGFDGLFEEGGDDADDKSTGF